MQFVVPPAGWDNELFYGTCGSHGSHEILNLKGARENRRWRVGQSLESPRSEGPDP